MKLLKLASTHENLRTHEVIGDAVGVPMVGSNFVMIAEPIDKNADYRFVTTTRVKSVRKISEKVFEFSTKNSSYRVEIL